MCGLYDIQASAKTLIKQGTFEFVNDDSMFDEFEFYMSQDQYLVILCEVTDSEGDYLSTSDGIRMSIYSYYNNYNETITWNCFAGSGMCAYYYSDNKLPGGAKYTVSFEGIDETYLDVKYVAYLYSELATAISLPSTMDLKTEQKANIQITNQIPVDSYLAADIDSSNPNIASVHYDFSTHSWYVQANKAGECILIAKLSNGRQYTCKVTVTNPAAKIKYTTVTMNTGHTIKNSVLYTNQNVKWTSSNKKIATVTSKGTIKAKKIGKCTITAQVGKKKYKCKVNVIRRNPDFSGYIYDYYTRNNYFVVKIKNMGDAPLTILSSGAKAKDFDYKSFDRNLKISTTTIKAGKTKTLKFKVKGRTTWYDHTDFWIVYKFKYDGKTYTGRFYPDPEYSEFKKGSKYYYTYLGDDSGF